MDVDWLKVCVQLVGGYRPASCIVDVEWLKVWVQLVVKARDEQYRDTQLNILLFCGFK